uniref:U1snRNP70_N domain-containing protein n=1 Tax=Meloidogyne hapla TaxID=6305 RepID=A0A1I8AZM9_MELHA
MAYRYQYFNNFQQHPQPLYKQQSYRMQPDLLIRTVTTTKIIQEQRAAEAKALMPPYGVRMRPEFLIQAVTESKLAQKRAATAAKLAAAEAKRAAESEKLLVPRAIIPPDFGSLNDNSMLKIADFVPGVPPNYEKEFSYRELTMPVPLPTDGLYSKEQILIIGAQHCLRLEVKDLRRKKLFEIMEGIN